MAKREADSIQAQVPPPGSEPVSAKAIAATPTGTSAITSLDSAGLTVSRDRAGRAATLPVIAGAILALVLLVFAIGRGYNHDEEQFIAAGVLAMQGEVYRDFIYLQTPLYPELLAAAFQLTGGGDGGYFLASRLLTWLLTLGCCAMLWQQAVRLTHNHMVGLGTTLLFITSTAVLAAVDSSRNDMAPCAAGLAGILLTLRGLDADVGRRRLLGLAGLLLALSVGLKLSWGFAPLGIMIYVLLMDSGRTIRSRILDSALPLTAGGFLGLLLILSYAIGAWDGFIEGNFTYHLDTPMAWHRMIGRESYFGAEHLAEFLNRRVFSDAVMAVVILIAITMVATRATHIGPAIRERLARNRASLTLLLVVLALIAGLLPRPPYIQYFHPFAAMLALSAPFLFHALAPMFGARGAIFAGVVIVGCLPGTALLMQTAPKLVMPHKWMVNRVAEASASIRGELAAAGTDGPVLTLTPIFALEAGLDIYPELSAGPFFYRTGDRLKPAEIDRLNGVTPETLDELLRDRPPAAILVGKEEKLLEQPFIDYARANGFIERRVPRFSDLRLWVKPSRGARRTR